MIDEAKKIITAIRQMEASLVDSKRPRKNSNDESLKITYPLVRCLQTLKEKHGQVQRLHRERLDQVYSELLTRVFRLADSSLLISHPRARRGPRVVLVAPGAVIRQDCPAAPWPQPVRPSDL